MKLKDFATINMGQSPKGETYNTDGNGMPFLQGRKTFGRIYPTIDTWTTNPIKKANKNEILMSVRAPVGDMNFANQEICIGRGLCSIRAKNGRNKYLYYMLLNSMNDLKQKSTGTVFDSINRNDLENLDINFHSEAEQEKIESMLGNIDDKIELNNQINNNLLEIGETIFNEWIDKCTDELYIYDIAEEILDYTKNNNEYIKILNSSDITENLFSNVTFVENKDLKGHFKKRFNKYDILYSQIRPRNHHYGYALMNDSEDYVISTRFMVVRNKINKVSSSLLYFYLTSEEAIIDFTNKTECRSGTFPQGNYQDLSSFKVKYSNNQQEITRSLDVLLEKIYRNNLENQTLEQLRNTLLPKLMNGEIDLENIEI